MSDINQPCPTICSACKGKCSDQLVLPAGCVLRPTIERVEAVLTPQLAKLSAKAQIDFCLDKYSSFELALARAISREVVAVLAADQRELIEAVEAARDVLSIASRYVCGEGTDDEIATAAAAEQLIINAIAKHTPPAASGIGESGGEG